jgi:hypothetical protein
MALDRAKLTKLLGMLGSAHDGERAAAGKLASDLIRHAGLSWAEVLDGGADGALALDACRQLLAENEALRDELDRLRAVTRPRPPQPYSMNNDWRDNVDNLLLWRDRLNGWEQEFLEGLSERWSDELTERQAAALARTGIRLNLRLRAQQ